MVSPYRLIFIDYSGMDMENIENKKTYEHATFQSIEQLEIRIETVCDGVYLLGAQSW
jgi:hypothetical protein